MNIPATIQLALEHHRAGNLSQAEHIYRKILRKQSNNVDALHLLGVLYHQLGNCDIAITYIKKALQIDPHFAEAYNNLGNVFQDKKELDEAITYYQKALQINPHFAEAYNNLGNVFQDKKELDEAITYYQKALQINPHFAEAYNNLGNVFQDKKELDKAITYYQKALQIQPNYAIAYNNLGRIFKDKGQVDEAITYYQKALQINPHFADAYKNLGSIFQSKVQFDEAIACYQKAIQLKPSFADAYNNLGGIYHAKGQPDEAELYYKRAIQIKPDEAIYYGNFLFEMLYNPRYDAHTIFSEHVKFGKQFTEHLSSNISPHNNKRIANRRLRIGYVSPDFRGHSVTYFLEAAFIAHNREHFEFFCYSNNLDQDEITKRLQEYTDQWRCIVGISDENADALIRKDNIDILVDLSGHTAKNRLLLFARKPAPVQVSWIGYPATTGLSTIDYKIVDSYTDPPGMTEQFYIEELMRLPDSFLCYMPDKDSPEVSNLPSLTSGYIRFGSFNYFTKVSPEVFKVWVKILREVPDSRLIMKTKSLADRTTRHYAMDMFAREGIATDRIELLSWEPSTRDHLNLYNRIDIGLDTFPYNGTTTTCEAMWMGVPVITLAGGTHASRVGVSLLSNIGLTDLIAKTHDEYVSIAVNLATDIKRLQILRERLRNMVSQSPLTDAERFTVNLEKCYRTMWETWCKSV